MKTRIAVLILALVLSSGALLSAQDRFFTPVNEGWRFTLGDDMAWADPAHDDSGWEAVSLPTRLKLSGAGQYFWLRAELAVPGELSGTNVWFETGKAMSAFDLYADGVYLGTRGRLPPEYYSRPQANQTILIPANLLEDGSVTIALRCYYNGSEAYFPGFRLVDDRQSEFVMHLQNLFNMRVYVILAVLCLFLGAYFISQFISRPDDKASIFFALSLLFIAIYFYDMGAERVLVDPLVQRAVGRASLSVSIGFLMLFLMSFFKSPGYKLATILVPADIAVFGLAFMLNAHDDSAIDFVFNLSLGPIFLVVILGVLIVLRAVKLKQKDAWPIFVGLIVGVGFGVHDIIYQVTGNDPFAWLQGFTFFSIDLAVFVAMASRSSRFQRELDGYMRETSEQRDRLSSLVASAEKLATDTSELAKALDSAVAGMASSAESSAEEAKAIGQAVQRQTRSVSAAGEAVSGLVASLREVNHELEDEAASIAKTAGETGGLIEAFQTVGEGIDGAASFATGLDGLTSGGRKDMELLADAMGKVKDYSSEILGVVEAVNDFAERTNLLAMNASIEAAHAGSSGRGFGVIAQEIKKLAAASADRAARIGEIATTIDSAVGQGFELSIRVRDALTRIAAEASGTASRVKEAAAGMTRQRESGARIASESERLAEAAARMREEGSRQTEYSDRVSASMNELSGAAGEVGLAAELIVARNVELAERAVALRDLATKARGAAEDLAAIMRS
ncbi:MAG: hypothetical protein JW923_01020 [Spirochaetales bacterium]|nr:hypothetical protein [Spirochaetales bacterium]